MEKDTLDVKRQLEIQCTKICATATCTMPAWVENERDLLLLSIETKLGNFFKIFDLDNFEQFISRKVPATVLSMKVFSSPSVQSILVGMKRGKTAHFYLRKRNRYECLAKPFTFECFKDADVSQIVSNPTEEVGVFDVAIQLDNQAIVFYNYAVNFQTGKLKDRELAMLTKNATLFDKFQDKWLVFLHDAKSFAFFKPRERPQKRLVFCAIENLDFDCTSVKFLQYPLELDFNKNSNRVFATFKKDGDNVFFHEVALRNANRASLETFSVEKFA